VSILHVAFGADSIWCRCVPIRDPEFAPTGDKFGDRLDLERRGEMGRQRPIQLRIDDTGKASGLKGALERAITVHLPDPGRIRDPAVAMFGYRR